MSSPLGMARAECANFCKDGSCLGIPVECLVSERDGKKVKLVAAPLERCKLSEPGKRCMYFERAVIPLANYFPEKYAKAVETYTAGRAKNALAIKAARLCKCGNPLPKRKRYCPTCARRKRRESARNGMAKKRRDDVSS